MRRRLGLASYERIAKDLEPAGIGLTLRTIEGVDRRADPNLDKAAVLDHFLPGCTRQTTSNSRGP